MANPHKGEVELVAGEERYTLRFSIDAICSLESSTGKGLPALIGEISDPDTMSVARLRDMLLAALAEHHPDITLKQAGELIVPAGGFIKVFEKVSEAIAVAFPAADPAAPKEKGARPPKGPRQGGTGRPS